MQDPCSRDRVEVLLSVQRLQETKKSVTHGCCNDNTTRHRPEQLAGVYKVLIRRLPPLQFTEISTG